MLRAGRNFVLVQSADFARNARLDVGTTNATQGRLKVFAFRSIEQREKCTDKYRELLTLKLETRQPGNVSETPQTRRLLGDLDKPVEGMLHIPSNNGAYLLLISIVSIVLRDDVDSHVEVQRRGAVRGRLSSVLGRR